MADLTWTPGPDLTWDPQSAAAEKPAKEGFTAGDYLKGLKKGLLEVPGSLTGLADIPIAAMTGQKIVGPAAEALGKGTGLEFSKWAKETGETLSPGAQAAQAKINEAWQGSGADRLGNALLGNFDDIPEAWRNTNLRGAGKAILENPGASLMPVVESVPGMVAGGAIGKGVAVASKVAPWLAGGIGEGAITAGQQMDQTADTVDPRKAALTSLAAGAGTGLIGAVGGKLSGKLGFDDLQTAMAGGAAGSRTKLLPRIAGGAAMEAAQELPQSMQETAWQNLAEGNPLGTGVIRSGVEGAIAGAVMGGGAGLRPRARQTDTPAVTPEDIAGADASLAGLQQSMDAYQAMPSSVPLLPERPSVIPVTNPTTGTTSTLDPLGGPLESAAAGAVAAGVSDAANRIDDPSVLFPFANQRAARDYVGKQADPEMYDVIPHPRDPARTAVVPKTGTALQELLTRRQAEQANQAAVSRNEALRQEEDAQAEQEKWARAPNKAAVEERILGAFGDGSRGSVRILPRNDGGFDVQVRAQKGASKRSSESGFPPGTKVQDAIAVVAKDYGGFSSSRDKAAAAEKAKRSADTIAADRAQDELAPAPAQPVTSLPGVQQRAKAQAAAAVLSNQVRGEQLASEETPNTVDLQAQSANASPTEGQKKAGNYAHGHITVGGLDISVETPAGATRTGRDGAKSWKVKNTAHYGYLKRTRGADGENVDVYVRPGTSATHQGPVFVVDQYNPATGEFDEHKVLLGYTTQAQAAKAYDAHFSDRSGPKRRGAVTGMALGEFKSWLKHGDAKKAVSGSKFGEGSSDPAQVAQQEIAQSTGAQFSLPRSAQKPGESDADFLLRRAAATQAKKAGRGGQVAPRKPPTKAGDQAAVREAFKQPDDAPVSILSAESRPDAGQAKGVSKQAAQFIVQAARVFGKRVVFFDVPDRGAAEGFHVQGDTVYLNVNSSTQHLRVLGHELTHAMKNQAGEAYEKMLGAVAALRTDAEMVAEYQDYFGEALNDAKRLNQPHAGGPQTLREFLAEEWMADLSGNRFAEGQFWTDVFTELENQHGDKAARGIIARVRMALVAALNKIKTLIGGNAFAVDARLGEHLDDIRKAVTTGFAEYARLSKAGQLSEAAGAETKFAKANLGAMTPAQAQAATRVLGAPKTRLERLADFKKDWAKNLKQGIFDQFAPIADLDQNAYIQARLSKGGDSTLEALMLYGKLFVGADGATDVHYTQAGKMQGFASKMAKLNGEHDRFLLWVAAQRADRLKGIGLENLWSGTDIAELKNLNQGNQQDGTARAPLFAQAMADLNAFNDNVLEVAEASGLIDSATRQLYQNTPYVPFYRLQEDDTIQGFGITPGLVNQYAWKKLKGGTQKLNEDLMANLLHNWSHLITASAKNRAAQATLDAAVRAGIAQPVATSMGQYTAAGGALLPPGTKGQVSYREAGTEKPFVVSDPHLLEAVAALHYSGLGAWAKPLSTAKHWLTVGVTANPAFKLRNLIRDTIGALGTAQLSYRADRNLVQGWNATGVESETRAHMLASGGMIRFGSMLDGRSSQRAEDLIHQGVDSAMILDSDSKIQAFWKRHVAPALSAYNELGDRTENVNRAALYEQLIKKGLTHAEASYWARDLMDFSMGGKWTAIRTLVQTVPFFNARLQGLYKLGRAGKQDIRRMGIVLSAVSLASLALMLAGEDDEDWKERSDSDRNNYWWFKVGGHAFRVPKPFEIGAVGTLAERGYELMFNPEMTGNRFGRNLRDIVMNQLSMNPVPQLFKPMMDTYANMDSFTGRDIESMGMERLQKADRYDERTSETAKLLGRLGLPDPAQFAMGRLDTLSPKQVDHLAKGYFSWLATMTTTILDYGIRPMINAADRPDRQLKDVFFVGNFVESLPSNQSRYLTQMYDQAREIEQAYASYQARVKAGDFAGAKAFREDHLDLFKRRPATEQLKKASALLNIQIQRVTDSRTLTGEEKRTRLDMLYQRRNHIAERFQAL